MRNKNALKRIIAGTLALTMSGVMLFNGSLEGVQEVQATTKVFDKIKDNYSNEIKILEIVPGSEINSQAEIGYMIGNTEREQNPTQVTKGSSLATPYSSSDSSVGEPIVFDNSMTIYETDTAGEYTTSANADNVKKELVPYDLPDDVILYETYQNDLYTISESEAKTVWDSASSSNVAVVFNRPDDLVVYPTYEGTKYTSDPETYAYMVVKSPVVFKNENGVKLYLKDGSTDIYTTDESKAKRLDSRFADALLKYRTYGLVVPSGSDGLGTYPIYLKKDNKSGSGMPIFSEYSNVDTPNAYKSNFVLGVYSLNAAGDYKVAEGYTIDENGRICKVDTVPVSGNTILDDGYTVSQNSTGEYTYNESTGLYDKKVLTPVDDVSRTEVSLPKSGSVNYITKVTAGTGDVSFQRSESVTDKQQYYGLSDQTLYYADMKDKYFFYHAYFADYVLGDESYNSNIIYSVKQAHDVSTEDIQDADLIYISGTAETFASAAMDDKDLTDDVLKEIYNQEVSYHKAVMMDYAAYDGKGDTNVSKLAILLWQENQQTLYNEYHENKDYPDVFKEDTENEGVQIVEKVSFLKDEKVLKALKEKIVSVGNGNFVAGNTYVYNHHIDDFAKNQAKSMVDALDQFANGDFNTPYAGSVAVKGFGPVLTYVQATNKNSTTGSMDIEVTPAVAIQYILVSDGQPLSIIKQSLRVLEIQPCAAYLFNNQRGTEQYNYLDYYAGESEGDPTENFVSMYNSPKANRDLFISQYLDGYYDDKADYIDFESMTINEFNARNEDLVENYDIVYIGDEMARRVVVSGLNGGINRKNWTATAIGAPSYAIETPGDGRVGAMLDGNEGTFFHSNWQAATNAEKDANSSNPLAVMIDMQSTKELEKITVLPRQSGQGNILKYRIYVSDKQKVDLTALTAKSVADRTTELSEEKLGEPDASGTWANDTSLKQATLDAKGRYILLIADETSVSGGNKGHWLCISEINAFAKHETYKESSKVSSLHYLYNCNQSANTKVWNGSAYVDGTGAVPKYCDQNLNGNIYYNIGDQLTTYNLWNNSLKADGNGTYDIGFHGWYSDELKNHDYIKTGNVNEFLKNKIWAVTTDTTTNPKANSEGKMVTRYPRRDLTKTKLKKLEEFLESNSLVIVAEDLYGTSSTESDNPIKNTVINPTKRGTDKTKDDPHGRVDTSSNMYELLKFGMGERFDSESGKYINSVDSISFPTYPNLVSASDIVQNFVQKADLNKYVSNEKVSIILTSKPDEYQYSAVDGVIDVTKVNYLKTKENGTRYLKYEFSILSDSGSIGKTYIPHLYVDVNNDGKYSKTKEDVGDMVISVKDSGTEVGKNEKGQYVLNADVNYVLRRDISDEYCGILKWKLDIQSVSSLSSHASEEGYTLVENETGKDQEVRILQLCDNGRNQETGDPTGYTGTIDLQSHLYKYTNGGKEGKKDKWGKFIANVPGYKIHIKSVTLGDLEKWFDSCYEEYKKKDPDITPEKYGTEIFFPHFLIESKKNTVKLGSIEVKNYNGSPTNKNITYNEDVEGANMLVFGFGDNYDVIRSGNLLRALTAYMDNGNPVMTSHDFLGLQSANTHSRFFRQSFGQDLYGISQNFKLSGSDRDTTVTWANYLTGSNYTDHLKEDGTDGYYQLHSGLSYDRNSNADIVSAIEKNGKEVAYEPNTERRTTAKETHGYTYFILSMGRTRTDSGQWYSWFIPGSKTNEVSKLASGKVSGGAATGAEFNNMYTVQKINDGQITHYPYVLPDSFELGSKTHSQYFTLDLTSDADNDGESDVVVWYALGKSSTNGNLSDTYSEDFGNSLDPANGYFIYNKGNITYTGSGHSDMNGATDPEIQLFVNAMMAAFKSGMASPDMGFYASADINAKPIYSIAVPYDGNVTNPSLNDGATTVDSAVVKDKDGNYINKFIDPNNNPSIDAAKDGTLVFFRVGDNNFVRGDKSINVRYFLKVDSKKKVADGVASSGTTGEDNDSTPTTKYKYPINMKDSNGKPILLDVESVKIDGDEVDVVDISRYIQTYSTNNGVISATAMNRDPANGFMVTGIKSGDAYGIYLPMNYLNDNASFTIIAQAQTVINSVSTSGETQSTSTGYAYKALSITKADLLNLD